MRGESVASLTFTLRGQASAPYQMLVALLYRKGTASSDERAERSSKEEEAERAWADSTFQCPQCRRDTMESVIGALAVACGTRC